MGEKREIKIQVLLTAVRLMLWLHRFDARTLGTVLSVPQTELNKAKARWRLVSSELFLRHLLFHRGTLGSVLSVPRSTV